MKRGTDLVVTRTGWLFGVWAGCLAFGLVLGRRGTSEEGRKTQLKRKADDSMRYEPDRRPMPPGTAEPQLGIVSLGQSAPASQSLPIPLYSIDSFGAWSVAEFSDRSRCHDQPRRANENFDNP